MRQVIGAAMAAAMGLWAWGATAPAFADPTAQPEAVAALPATRPQPRPRSLDPTGGQSPAAAPPAADAPQAAAPPAPAAPPAVGPVTGLPMPRYVSLRAGEGNARRGPGMTHRIDWVFTRREMPLRVVAEFEHWRRVEDAEGLGGWIHFALLSGVRTVLVQQEMTPLHLQPDLRAPLVAHLEAGVVARLQSCDADWCRLRVDGLRGWAPKSALWGVEAAEIID
ncbi:MAG: SH3 domain-containing protein [Alkalilacustris sp.]